jgi:hypothetical protein
MSQSDATSHRPHSRHMARSQTVASSFVKASSSSAAMARNALVTRFPQRRIARGVFLRVESSAEIPMRWAGVGTRSVGGFVTYAFSRLRPLDRSSTRRVTERAATAAQLRASARDRITSGASCGPLNRNAVSNIACSLSFWNQHSVKPGQRSSSVSNRAPNICRPGVDGGSSAMAALPATGHGVSHPRKAIPGGAGQRFYVPVGSEGDCSHAIQPATAKVRFSPDFLLYVINDFVNYFPPLASPRRHLHASLACAGRSSVAGGA